MTKYPLIESMGLKITDDEDFGIFVSAHDLEKALQDAPVWYGVPKLDSWSSADICPHDTHTARLVCVQPVKKKTKGEAAIELAKWITGGIWPRYLKDKAKEILEMPD